MELWWKMMPPLKIMGMHMKFATKIISSPLPHMVYGGFSDAAAFARYALSMRFWKSRKCEKLYQRRHRQRAKGVDGKGDSRIYAKQLPYAQCVCVRVIYVCNLYGELCQDFEPDKLEK